MTSIQIKPGNFTLRLLLILIAVAGIALLIALGCWQLSRAEQKRLLQIEYETRTKQAPINFVTFTTYANPATLIYYRLRVTGHFDNTHSFLLDNRFYQHQLGYEVITPFIPDGSDSKQVLLINRGFVPLGNNRQSLPTIATPDQRLTLTGIITVPDPKSFALSHLVDNPGQWPARIEFSHFPTMTQLLQQPLYPVIVLLLPQQPAGFIREWQLTTMSPDTHRAYAFQWFAMAGTLGVIFVVMSWKRRKNLSPKR